LGSGLRLGVRLRLKASSSLKFLELLLGMLLQAAPHIAHRLHLHLELGLPGGVGVGVGVGVRTRVGVRIGLGLLGVRV
jgi:hypothetical protein